MSTENDQTPAQTPSESSRTATLASEAADRRRKLRAAEATIAEREEENAALRARLDAADQREVQQLAAEVLLDPADLWMVRSIDDLRGEDGTVDVDKAKAAIAEVAEAKPHWKVPVLPDLHAGTLPPVPAAPQSFGDALKDAGGTGA